MKADQVSKADVLTMSVEVQKTIKQSMPEGYYLTNRNNFFNQDIIERISRVYKEDLDFIKENILYG